MVSVGCVPVTIQLPAMFAALLAEVLAAALEDEVLDWAESAGAMMAADSSNAPLAYKR